MAREHLLRNHPDSLIVIDYENAANEICHDQTLSVRIADAYIVGDEASARREAWTSTVILSCKMDHCELPGERRPSELDERLRRASLES
jgi:hypothetical protein